MMTIEEIEGLVAKIEPPIEPTPEHLVTCSMASVQDIINSGQQTHPNVQFIKNGKLGVIFTHFKNDDDKDQFAQLIASLRKDYQAVCFITEAWMSVLDAKQYKPGAQLPRPSQDPKREEAALIHLYIGKRTIMFVADIKRNPTQIAPWKVWYDSAVDKKKLEGRFA